jgi:Flp pilus assembly protein TadD
VSSDSSADAFAPPVETEPPLIGLALTASAWAMAGAALGTAIGATLHLLDIVPEVVPIGLATALIAGILGVVAWTLERRASRGRPEVLDGHGRHARPFGVWLLALPLALGVGSLLALVVIGTVHTGSVEVGVAFGVVALGFAALGRPLVVSHLLGNAVQAAVTGDRVRAERVWGRLARAWWVTRSGRDQAALNLGLLSLQGGDLDQAEHWYRLPRSPRAGAFAAAGLALVLVLRGRLEEAEALLVRASAGGRATQSEVDGVRLLLVLRRDGPGEARALGERLFGPDAGLLFLGVLATARRGDGDPAGAAQLWAVGLGEALARSPLTGVVPELTELMQRLDG